MEEANGQKKFNPQKYGMKSCDNCGGLGKSTNEARGVEVCRVCGGFELMKMEGWTASKPSLPFARKKGSAVLFCPWELSK